eukprot:Selendium_serpulae@DN5993_c0_g2_i1.p1
MYSGNINRYPNETNERRNPDPWGYYEAGAYPMPTHNAVYGDNGGMMPSADFNTDFGLGGMSMFGNAQPAGGIQMGDPKFQMGNVGPLLTGNMTGIGQHDIHDGHVNPIYVTPQNVMKVGQGPQGQTTPTSVSTMAPSTNGGSPIDAGRGAICLGRNNMNNNNFVPSPMANLRGHMLCSRSPSPIRQPRTAYISGPTTAKWTTTIRDTLNEFDTISVIGQGGYAIVRSVIHRETGEVFALKQLAKLDIVDKNQQHLVRNELEFMYHSDACPYVPYLFDSWQDENFLYMLMEFLPGGDLMKHLIDMSIFPERMTRTYIAQLVVAIGAVHDELGYVHRDVKPDNILLDQQGRIKLIDFGLCKRLLDTPSFRVQNRSTSSSSTQMARRQTGGPVREHTHVFRDNLRTPVGTPDYMAPVEDAMIPGLQEKIDRHHGWMDGLRLIY